MNAALPRGRLLWVWSYGPRGTRKDNNLPLILWREFILYKPKSTDGSQTVV
jgi:hypothetical protein